MNQSHSTIPAVLVDFYAGDWVDRLDEAKTNINERDVLACGGAMALGRKVDDQIVTALALTATSAVTIGVATRGNVLASAIQLTEAAWAGDIPNDGQVYAAVTPRFWSQLMTLDQFQRADYVGSDGLAMTTGPSIGFAKWKDWMGVKWKMQTGLPGAGTTTAKSFLWHKTAVGYAVAADAGNVAGNGCVSADITWHGDRAAHFVNHWMSGGAINIDDAGIIPATINDTSPIAAS